MEKDEIDSIDSLISSYRELKNQVCLKIKDLNSRFDRNCSAIENRENIFAALNAEDEMALKLKENSAAIIGEIYSSLESAGNENTQIQKCIEILRAEQE